MQSSHAGKQSYKNALSFFFLFVYLSVHPVSTPCLSVQTRVCHRSLSFKKEKKNPGPCGGKTTVAFTHPVLTSTSLPVFSQDVDCISWCQICHSQLHLIFFSLTFWPMSAHELPLKPMFEASRFVYQNIDLFSLYTSTLAFPLVRFFSVFPPLRGFPSVGHPQLDVDLPLEQLLAARRTRERWAVYIWGYLCLIGSVGLCVWGKHLSDWSLSKSLTELPANRHFVWHRKCPCGGGFLCFVN